MSEKQFDQDEVDNGQDGLTEVAVKDEGDDQVSDQEAYENGEDESYDQEEDFDAGAGEDEDGAQQRVSDRDPSAPARETSNKSQQLQLTIPKSLFIKLKMMAADEGISIDDLAFELIAEGAVVRAWEIVEKKSTMRQGGGNGNAGNNQGNNRYRQNRNGNGGGQRRHNNNNGGNRRGQPSIHKLIEDKASFMEYVRNQEKKRR